LDVPEHWWTVRVTDEKGRLDVQASSTFDAAHLYVPHTKNNPGAQLPVLTLATVFEIVTSGRIYRVKGGALQRWIAERRQEWKDRRASCLASAPRCDRQRLQHRHFGKRRSIQSRSSHSYV
jgi:hypothetical protein